MVPGDSYLDFGMTVIYESMAASVAAELVKKLGGEIGLLYLSSRAWLHSMAVLEDSMGRWQPGARDVQCALGPRVWCRRAGGVQS